MSLYVYLTAEAGKRVGPGTGIFIREDGQTRELSRAEWDERFPDREPVVFVSDRESDEVYSANITHNLSRMAGEAGLYYLLWRPEEVFTGEGPITAGLLIAPMEVGLADLKARPDHFRQFNPENGWGNYEGLVGFVENYLQACRENPDAIVRVSR